MADIRDLLAKKLAEHERAQVPRAFDIVGSIAIIDLPDALRPKAALVAQAIMAVHKHVTTVLQKTEKHDGEFRTQRLERVAGEDTRETLVRESGVELLVDVEQVYFSVRSSTERMRIARLVQPAEKVLVLFSGAGPFACVIAKHAKPALVVGVEKNPVGHRYAEENARRNRLANVRFHNADAADLTFLPERFDRIVMPLPASSFDFVPAALSVAADEATLHVYAFAREEELPAVTRRLAALCTTRGFSCSVTRSVRAGHHAPYVYRWCLDARVSRRR